MKNSFEIMQTKGAEAARQGTAGPPLTDEWRQARERVMLYLELLGVPRQQADALALEALLRASREPCVNPFADAMGALHELLGEQRLRISSMPPLNRGAMVPVEIDRRPWLTFFKKRILRKK
jgi:hypothetical protein